MTNPKSPMAATLYALFRIEVANIPGAKGLEVVQAADDAVPYHELANAMNGKAVSLALPNGMRITEVAYAEDVLHGAIAKATVVEDDSYEEFFGHNLNPFVNGVPAEENALKCKDSAEKFMTELLDSVETLGQLADEYSPDILAQIIYLQNAILNDSFIDHTGSVHEWLVEVLDKLPSATTWKRYIR